MKKIIVLDNGQFEKPRWNLWSLTAYTLMFDPCILVLGNIPRLVHPEDHYRGSGDDLILYPYPLEDDSLARLLGESARQGANLLLVRPGPCALKQMPELEALGRARTFPSLKESLSFCWDNGRQYHLPENQSFQIFGNRFDRVLARVGDVAACGTSGRHAVFTIDPIDFIIHTLYDDFVDPPRDISLLLALVVNEIAGNPLTAAGLAAARKNEALRRDFHSYGFARVMVEQLAARLKQADVPDLTKADRAIVKAAEDFTAGKMDAVGPGLKKAFSLLLKERQKLYPGQIYLFDLLHGGGMFHDSGFFEYDWPQHVATLFRSYLHLSETRGYRFILDVMAKSLEELAERFPVLRQELAEAWDKGWLEIVNGTYGQPFPQLYSAELGLRQYELGVREIERKFGKRPTVFATQEFGFTPQTPQILGGFGYDSIVQRVYNNGDCKVQDVPLINWRGPDGSRMKTLPSFRTRSQKRYEFIYNNISYLIAEDISHGYPWVTVSCHGDQTWYRFFREELARTAFYAPVLGKFSTYRDFFAEIKEKPVEQSFGMDDFESCWCLDFSKWSNHRHHTGDNLTNFTRALVAERAIVLAGAVQSYASLRNGVASRFFEDAWKALAMFASHDALVVPRFTQGEFCHKVDFPGYCGPVHRDVSIEDIAGRDLEAGRQAALETARKALIECVGPGNTHWAVFNPLPFARTMVVNLPGGTVDLALALPAFGYCRVRRAKTHPAAGKVRVDAARLFLENDHLRIMCDRETGAMSSCLDRKSGREQLAGPAHLLVMGDKSDVKVLSCRKIRATDNQAVLGIRGRIRSERLGECGFVTEYSLHATDAVVRIRTSFESAGIQGGDQWLDSIRASYTIGRKAAVYRLTQNFCEETKLDRFTSPLYCSCQTRKGRLNLFNAGTLAYRRRNDHIEAILLYENESARMFDTAISFHEHNIMRETLAWQTPPLVAPAGAGPESDSLFSLKSDNVVLLSVEPAGDQTLSMRLAETGGLATMVRIEFGLPLKAVWLTDFMGKAVRPVDCTKREITCPLGAWKIIQLRVEFQRTT